MALKMRIFNRILLNAGKKWNPEAGSYLGKGRVIGGVMKKLRTNIKMEFGKLFKLNPSIQESNFNYTIYGSRYW